MKQTANNPKIAAFEFFGWHLIAKAVAFQRKIRSGEFSLVLSFAEKERTGIVRRQSDLTSNLS